MCGNVILSGICANNFSPWGCSFKNESSSSSSSSSGSGSSSSSGSGSSSIYDSDFNSDSNPNPNPNPSLNPNPNPNPNLNSNLNPNFNPNLNPSPEALIRNCNNCNYIKPPTDFDETKYTCRSCTSAKFSCPYCTSVVRYDGIRAHVKKQHPDVELTRGYSRNLRSRFPDLSEKTFNPGSTKLPLYTSLDGSTKDPIVTLNGESCSCKYYDFVSFLINNGLNIEKVKENINLLKSIDNLK